MHDDGSHDHLDQLIDQVARTMTAGQPSPALRSGVRSRIDRPIQGWSLVGWRAAVGGVALVVIAVAAVLMIEPQAPDPPGAAGNRRDISLQAQVQVDLQPGGVAEDPQPRESTPVQDAPSDEPTPLPFAALSVERVAIEPLAPEPVTLEEFTGPVPLQVQRLDITALSLDMTAPSLE